MSRSLFIPAMLYFIANVASVYALSSVRSYIFSAIMNARIVFAAFLSLILLRKVVTPDQWRAIIIIFCSATLLCLEDVKVRMVESR
jgi:drug/metabolite transporter (DMT)-like permease